MFENDQNFDFDENDVLFDTSFTSASTKTTITKNSPNETASCSDNSNPNRITLSNKENAQSSLLTRNLSNDSLISSPYKVVKRRFPGPAGLLPDVQYKSDISLGDFPDKSFHQHNETNPSFLCSQQTASVFGLGPWSSMSKDFETSSGVKLFEKFNIVWIKKNAASKNLTNNKAPFLAAVIQSLEIFDGKVPAVSVTLKDSSGEIQATVLHSLYEEFTDNFTSGSVLVLQNCGVLPVGYNKHCLTITSNNLLCIYSAEKSLGSNDDSGDFANVKKTTVKDCIVDEILESFHRNAVSKSEIANSLQLNAPKTSLVNNKPALSVLKRSNECLSDSNRTENNKGSAKKFKFNKDKDKQNTFSLIPEKSNDCDKEKISKSKVFVKSDNIEHAEIWKISLEGVDVDQLFDDF